MSDAEDNSKTGDRESKESKDKSKEDGMDNQVSAKAEDGKDDGGKTKEKVTPSKKNAKTKNQKKEEKTEVKEEEEEEEEDDDDDDDDEDEGANDTNGKVPLLDQPLQISGTRDRKKVQRFSEEFKPIPKESPKNEIPEGRGQQLGEIPRVEAIIQKYTSEKLKPLYRLLFNRPGKPALVKKNIRKFNGFDFKEGSEQYTRKRASILKLDIASLRDLSRTLDLTVGGSREEVVNRLLDFLMEPKDSERPTKDSKKKRTASSSKKAKRQKSNSSSKGKKKKAESDDDEDEEESSEAEMDVDDEDDKESSEEQEKKDSEDEKEESEDDSKKRKPAKKKPAANSRKPAPKKADQKKEPENKKAEGKATDKKKRKETEIKSDDDESSEDEPLVKKTKQPPTDDEIKSYVKQILEGANLEEITMKTVCKQVYAAYPEFDLAHKKDFIKTTVKSLIST